MEEIVTFNPGKVEHLEALVENLNKGDLIKVYFGRGNLFEYPVPPRKAMSGLHSESRIIVAEEHMPEKYPRDARDPTSYDTWKRTVNGFAETQGSLIGILYGFRVGGGKFGGQMPFVDQKDKRIFSTKRTMWFMLGVTCHEEDYVIENLGKNDYAPTIYIDLHCLGAYEKLMSRVMWSISDETCKERYTNGFHDKPCNENLESESIASYECLTTEDQRNRLRELALKKQQAIDRDIKNSEGYKAVVTSIERHSPQSQPS